jgi:hypothetical protein
MSYIILDYTTNSNHFKITKKFNIIKTQNYKEPKTYRFLCQYSVKPAQRAAPIRPISWKSHLLSDVEVQAVYFNSS